jgi:hypothetical protein
MTSERSHAYGRVIKTLDDIGPAKLHANEQELIRDAADTLFFSESGTDAGAREAVVRVGELTGRMVEAGRLLDESAERLLRDLDDCGPATAIA